MKAAERGTADHATFGWPDVMHVGLCVLRLSPDNFWRLSPREFMAMAGAYRPRRDAMDREGLEALLKLFPDEDERS